MSLRLIRLTTGKAEVIKSVEAVKSAHALRSQRFKMVDSTTAKFTFPLSPLKKRKTRWLVLGLLVVQLSHAPLLYAAKPPLDNTGAAQLEASKAIEAEAIDTKASDNTPAANVHAQLTQIITSADYAEAQEQKQWQPIEEQETVEPNFWIYDIMLKVLKFLFGDNEGNSQKPLLSLLSLLIKIVLVGALIAFIAWIVKNAARNGWFKTLRNPFNKRPVVSKFQPSLLAQSWERLPPHHLIPQTVQALKAKNEIERAASVLYCGSLRWLKQAQGIAIAPATTEKQCLAQVQRIAKIAQLGDVNQGINQDTNHSMNQSAQRANASIQNHATKFLKDKAAVSSEIPLSELSAHYIKQVVYLWLQVAYSLPHDNRSLPLNNRPNDAAIHNNDPTANLPNNDAVSNEAINNEPIATSDKIAELNLQIDNLVNQWLDRLPPQAMFANQRSAIHGNSHSGLKTNPETAQGKAQ